MKLKISKPRLPSWLFYLLTFVFGVGIGLTILIVYGSYSQTFRTKFLTPLGLNPQILAMKVDSKKPLVGFLPYWTIFDAEINYHLLDYLVYFGVALQEDGSIKKQNEHNVEIGYYRLSSGQMDDIFATARKHDVKVGIAVTAFNNDVIDTLISDYNAKQTAIKNIVTLAEDYDLDTINVDFEYNNGEIINEKPEQLAKFVEDLKSALVDVNPDIEVSIDLYANAFLQDKAYDVSLLGEVSDHLILMGYDFHRAASANAGPVSPLKSSDNVNITAAIQAAIDKEVDPEKIIYAMPLYGYEWQTTTDKHGSPTYPESGSMASYTRVQTLIKDQDIQPNWDSEAMSPWIVYDVGNTTHQIYYEDDQSIGYKLQLIDQVGLGGGGFWALGYEGEDANLWKTVEQWRRKH